MRISRNKLIFGLLFLVIIFNNILQGFAPIFRYIDEMIAIVSITYVVINFKSIIKRPYNTQILGCMFVMAILALLGNVFYGYQSSIIAILKDILAFCKMPITFIAVYQWTCIHSYNGAHESAMCISKVVSLILFVCCGISIFTDIGLSYDVRYGFRSFMFLFSHPTFLVYTLVLMSSIIVSDQEKNQQKLGVWVYHIQILFCLLFSFRDKAFGYIALFFVLMVMLPSRRKIKLRYFVVAGLLALVVSASKIAEYRAWSWSPREALYTNGFQLMINSFPVGSGFATFNSAISGEYYSKAYYLFGLQNKPGMNPTDFVDIGDAQLPYYYVQFGIIGAILFGVILYTIFKCVKKRYAGKTMELKAAYLLLGYIVIGSLVEAVLTNESGATFVLILLLYLSPNMADRCITHKK